MLIALLAILPTGSSAAAAAIETHGRIRMSTLGGLPTAEFLDEIYENPGSVSRSQSAATTDGRVAFDNSAFLSRNGFDFMGVASSGTISAPSANGFPFINFTGWATTQWRDVIFAPPSLQTIRLNFEVHGDLNVQSYAGQASIGISATTDVSGWYVGGGTNAGIYYNGGGSGIDYSGWDSLSIAPFSDISFTGTIHLDTTYDPNYGGYPWLVRLSADALLFPTGLDSVPLELSADALSLRSIGITSITDQAGNVLTDLTFDSGLIFVPEPSTLLLVSIGVIAVRLCRRHRQAGR
jgi:hypothetical protein